MNFEASSIVLGLRNPKRRVGELDGAWVYLHKRGHGLACLYDSGKDWLSRPRPDEALSIYTSIKDNEGWRPMSEEDLKQTCGLDF